jgi:3-dehydroquinate dehydratase-1
MAARKPVNVARVKAATVAVVASADDLARARRLRRPPDFFELRLDALFGVTNHLDAIAATLPAPIILTARHPSEGGMNNLSAAKRRNLFMRFIAHAACVDIELRSIRAMQPVLDAAHTRGVRLIVSYHNLTYTPSCEVLLDKARAAFKAGAEIFKIATRTDTASALNRLVSFFGSKPRRAAISAMGIGKFGRDTRIVLRRSSALNYAHLGEAAAEGQLSLRELRALLRRR